jgi:uncharacterized protein YdhG (YjbR/CyaY superfamily)
MQYDVETATDYLEVLEDDWRKATLLALRELLLENPATLTEGINYKMLSYSDSKGVIFHLNAQKNYVSLYVGDIQKIDPLCVVLKGVSQGKGCIRFSKKTDVSQSGVEQFVSLAIKLWQEDEDIGC